MHYWTQFSLYFNSSTMITTTSLLTIIFTILLKRANCFSFFESEIGYIPEYERLQFCDLANKNDFECNSYNVITEDGYELVMQNVPGNSSKPVILQHGFLDSSDTFILRGTGSLVANLAKQGYDIWLGNMRGNKYSRKHESLSPSEGEFWDFSFHEIAIYDMPAMIDFVLKKTGQNKLRAIAHSEGTTLFFVMGSMRPEYNAKLIALICLAPIAHFLNAEKPIFPLVSATLGPIVNQVFTTLFSHGELLGYHSVLVQLIRDICTQKLFGYIVCAEGFAFPLLGYDQAQLEPAFFQRAIEHFPCGTSNGNLVHLQQLVDRRQFAQYDYGISKNQEVYKSSSPPVYDLSKVSMKIALVVGLTDRLADVEDVQLLRRQLPNVLDYYVMKRKQWNHVDFIWGKNMTELFEYIYYIFKYSC